MNTSLSTALERLDQRIDWEQLRNRSAMRVSVEPARDLSERLGHPASGMACVHVAGSKGKGSTAALIAAGLGCAGRRVALYGSPHVETVLERLLIQGELVDAELFARSIDQALDAAEAAQRDGSPARAATWFDIVTLAAFAAARAAGVEWLVAECGLGGRLDSTNVLSPKLCVITSIELEHVEVLGDTRAKIAAEKAGILKRGAGLVCGVPADDEAGQVIDRRAAELGVVPLRPAWLTKGVRPAIEERNVALARLALESLGFEKRVLDAETIAAARLPGRMERFFHAGVPIVLDGAHVPSSVTDVLAELSRDPALTGRPVVCLGLARGKDLVGVLKAVASAADSLVGTSLGGDLHRAPEEIVECARDLGLSAETAASPSDALDRACALAEGGGWVLITGSLWLAGALRPHLRASEDSRP